MLFDTYLNEMNYHYNDAVNYISEKRLNSKSNRKIVNMMVCFMSGCLAKPIARCVLCSKYSCYAHLQICLQLHSNEIEIINRLKSS